MAKLDIEQCDENLELLGARKVPNGYKRECCKPNVRPKKRLPGDLPASEQPAPSSSTLPTWLVPIVILASLVFRSADPLIKRVAMGENTKFAFALTTVVAISECTKFGFCCICLPFQYFATEAGYERDQLVRFRWNETWLYIIPAALFTLCNYLYFELVEYVNPAFLHVFGNMKILTTGVLFHTFGYFRVGGNTFSMLSGVQWVALFLLFTGVLMATPDLFSLGPETFLEGSFHTGLMISLCQVTIASFANVFTELLLKRDPSAPLDASGTPQKRDNPQSIFFQNGQLYFWGAITSLLYCCVIDWAFIQENGFFGGYEKSTVLAIASHVTLGLSTAFVFKFLDNIIYLFLTAACMVIVAVLSSFLFGFELSLPFILALLIISGSIFLYNHKKLKGKSFPCCPRKQRNRDLND